MLLEIVVILLAIRFLFYTIVFVVIDVWLGLRTEVGLKSANVLFAIALMSIIKYGSSTSKEPGSIPSFMSDIKCPKSSMGFTNKVRMKVALLNYSFFISTCIGHKVSLCVFWMLRR